MRDADSLFLPVLVGGSVDQLASRHSGLRSTSSVLGFAQTKFVPKSFGTFRVVCRFWVKRSKDFVNLLSGAHVKECRNVSVSSVFLLRQVLYSVSDVIQ